MATAAAQRRWRSRDKSKTVQVRLTRAAAERLDTLAKRRGAAGRGQIIEALLLAEDLEQPDWLSHEAVRLARGYFRATGAQHLRLCDADGWLYHISRRL